MKKLFIFIALTALFIMGVAYLVKNIQNQKINFNSNQVNQNLKEIKVGNTKIFVEIARSQEESQKGLSGKDSLDENTGMLFVFDATNVKRNFWMKGMKFPLDFIWIKDGKVVQIDKNTPAPDEGTEDSKLIIYTSQMPIDYVLEVNAGFSDKNNIKTGDNVDLSKVQ